MNSSMDLMTTVQTSRLYRNQFVLGPEFVDGLDGWKRIRINGSLCLMAHPDLNAFRIASDDRSITLVGYIIDPFAPVATDSDILRRLMGGFSDFDALTKNIYSLGGRWILVAQKGSEARLFNDAAGLRQVFYATGVSGIWCASQPGLLAEILGLSMDRDALSFMDSLEFRTHREYRWPGYSSPFREVRHLLPNHFLNLSTGACRRYWPDGALPLLPLEDAVDIIADTLQGFMRGISNRYDIAIGMTSGLDSRLVLAASKDISRRISFMSVRQMDWPDDHPDITVPSMLISALGMKHDLVRASPVKDHGFFDAFHRSVLLANDIYAPDAQAIYEYYGRNKVAVTGSVCEIGRCSFSSMRKKAVKKGITPADLARLQRMGMHSFALEHFDEWLSGMGNIYNIHVLDMFEWEQGHGNWLAMCQLQFDSAWRDLFTPFNCRRLLTDMLSVDERYRKGPDYPLYGRLITKLWPEVLSLPVNPHKKVSRARSVYRRARKAIARMLPA